MSGEMFYIRNMAEVKGTLRKYPKEVQDMLVKLMRIIVVKIQGAARKNAPVDTGRMRAAIDTRVHSIVGGVEGVVGDPVEYAQYVENPGPVRGVGRRPWLKPAFMENKDWIVNIILKSLENLARKMYARY